MTNVFACVWGRHDIGVIVVAVLVCLAGSWSVIRLFQRASAAVGSERIAWILLSTVIADAAIWCTHFIAMLGYHPGVAVSVDPALVVVSLLITTVGAGLGFAVAVDRGFNAIIGGAIIGLAIAGMHYTGMMAYRVNGTTVWNPTWLFASIVVSVVFAALALHVAVRRPPFSGGTAATVLLALAISGMHFTGMAAFHVYPLAVNASLPNADPMQTFALTVATVTALIATASLAIHRIDSRVRVVASEALNHMSNGLILVAGDGTIRLVNDRIREMLNLSAHSLHVGMSLHQYIHNLGDREGWDAPEIRRIVADVESWMHEGASVRIERRFGDGTILSIASKPASDGGTILTYDDVTEIRQGQRELAHMAFHDALTGLPNRRSLAEHVARLSQSTSFALLLLDLDHFSAINDTLGDAIGDAVLVEAARRVRDICGPSELPFRLGGDELVMTGHLTQRQADTLARRAIAALARPFEINGRTVATGASVGVAMADQGEDPQLVQRKARLALDIAKRNGRFRVEFYSDGTLEETVERKLLEHDLALAVESGQLELDYQPLYALPDRTLTGFEALLRWRHPVRGRVPPSAFIPLAEQCGAIAEIGAWVIDEACRQAALWPANLYVSINVSPLQLRSDDTPRQIADAIARHRLAPGRIEIEVTETGMLENSARIATALAAVRALGVRIAMDDFGTGYSSLVHIRDFAVDRIKIDRSFIGASDTDPNSAAVVCAVATLARSIGVATTGEGVENEAQLAKLIEYGCGTVQGFLLSRPLDAMRATELAHAHRDGQAARLTDQEINDARTL
ncbi:EAL domain-containing protein [Pararobbsia silviterrae]|uniref:EAL domain-containing protein n=1 Tax=Pararobbsia silviterrae TaxID=1792498 RepID=A0A494X802_9BURK|nr:EAL domain-containing protein [Pararobbsia silviterrae]RKP44466.1 EAL domain-containing protein [Pararobbsia silviterrae]